MQWLSLLLRSQSCSITQNRVAFVGIIYLKHYTLTNNCLFFSLAFWSVRHSTPMILVAYLSSTYIARKCKLLTLLSALMVRSAQKLWQSGRNVRQYAQNVWQSAQILWPIRKWSLGTDWWSNFLDVRVIFSMYDIILHRPC